MGLTFMGLEKKYSKLVSRIKSKNGNALVLVLILFLVISILSIAMLAVASSENAQVLAEEKIDQAHYTARAVVEATSDWISANFNARDQMALVIPDRGSLGESNAFVENNSLDGTPYELRVWRDTGDADLVHIKAKATYQGWSSTVSLALQETVSGYALFEDAIYSKGPFGKSSGNANIVVGSVATGSDSIPSNLNATAGKTVNKIYDFEDILPDASIVFPGTIPNITLNDNGIVNNDATNLNASYGTLRINDDVYIRNTDAAGNPKDVHILINDFYISESAIIHPSHNDGGRIFIYITNYIWCDKKFGIDGNDAHPIVYLICSGTGDINFSGNPYMNMYLYGPDVKVEYGGTTVLNGAIIANIYGWNGNISVTYRPPELEDSPFWGLNEAQKKVTISGQTWDKG